MRLIDTRRKERVSVALPDVGFGVSQILPFIVQSLASGGWIISIEQPEVHVHPKLQADLGDLLAEAIKEPRQNRFIIETHSEHLILRLQRLVAKSKSNQRMFRLSMSAVSLEGPKHYVCTLTKMAILLMTGPTVFSQNAFANFNNRRELPKC